VRVEENGGETRFPPREMIEVQEFRGRWVQATPLHMYRADLFELSTSTLQFQHPNSLNTPLTHLIVESSSYQAKTIKMAAPEVHQLFHHPIADHSFSADKQTLAVARDTSVELYGRTGAGFKLEDELKGHDKTVTSVDIALNSGRIVTCSQGMSSGF